MKNLRELSRESSLPSGLAACAFLLLTIGAPHMMDSYTLATMISVLMFSAASMGAWLLLSTGLWSFGQGAFALIGAYVSTLAVMRLSLPFWLGFLAAGVVSAGVAWISATLILRTIGVAFAILTLVLLLTVSQLITVFPDITGGQGGIIGVPPPAAMLSTPLGYYYFALALTGLFLLTLLRLRRTIYFTTLAAIRLNAKLASSVGVRVRHYQSWVFAYAGMWTGLIGAFSAPYLGVAHPAVWYIFPSIFIVAYAIIGGLDSPIGGVLGAGIMIGLSEFLRVAESLQPILVGLALILVSVLLPRGFLGLAAQAKAHLLGRRLTRVTPDSANVPDELSLEKGA